MTHEFTLTGSTKVSLSTDQLKHASVSFNEASNQLKLYHASHPTGWNLCTRIHSYNEIQQLIDKDK